MRKVSALAVLVALLAGPAHAQLSFNQLSACEDLGAGQAALRSDGAECRAPQSAVEQALAARLATWRETRYCFLARAPSTSLSRFGCLLVIHSAGRNLDCIAPARRSDVEQYKANPEAYNAQVSDYLAEADRCPLGNGDASVALRTLLSPIMRMVARFDLGFALQMGQAPVGESVVLHGYARLDPAITGREDGEVEFVSMWSRR